MFWIIGVNSKKKQRKAYKRYCPVCKKETLFIEYEGKDYLSLFFVSIFPINKLEIERQCSLCGYKE